VLARHDLANRIAVLMGGRASEALIFDGEVSTGAADHLQRATEIALQMVTRFGMDETVGPAHLLSPAAAVPGDSGRRRRSLRDDRARDRRGGARHHHEGL